MDAVRDVPHGASSGAERPLSRRQGAAPPLVGLPTDMANIKSQIKRNKQNLVRNERNKAVRTALKTATKKAQAAAAEGDSETSLKLAREASRALDKAASKGVVHKKTAARRKSRLARAANAASVE